MRIQISVSDDVVSRLDDLAKAYGVTRSACASQLLGKAVATEEDSRNLASNPEFIKLLANVLGNKVE